MALVLNGQISLSKCKVDEDTLCKGCSRLLVLANILKDSCNFQRRCSVEWWCTRRRFGLPFSGRFDT